MWLGVCFRVVGCFLRFWFAVRVCWGCRFVGFLVLLMLGYWSYCVVFFLVVFSFLKLFVICCLFFCILFYFMCFSL